MSLARSRQTGSSRLEIAVAILGIFLAAGLAPAGVTTRVSITSSGEQANGYSFAGGISADGRRVVFLSSAKDLYGGDPLEEMRYQAIVRDLHTRATILASKSSLGEAANDQCYSPTISAGGRYVSFVTAATNLVSDYVTGLSMHVYVHDLETGETTLEDRNSAGEISDGTTLWSSLSADGRFVAFASTSEKFGAPSMGVQIFVRDRLFGLTRPASVDSSGRFGNANSDYPTISTDGRYVAFGSEASDLVPGDTNGWPDVFVHDMIAGTTECASVALDGTTGNDISAYQSISGDGRLVAFWSHATDLVTDDTNECGDVFVRDLGSGETTRASVTSAGEQGDRQSGLWGTTISLDGTFVGFASDARNLVPGDENRLTDVFVHNLLTGCTTRASIDTFGAEANDASDYMRPNLLAADGELAFTSWASNLVDGDTNEYLDVFVRLETPPLDRQGAGSVQAFIPRRDLPLYESRCDWAISWFWSYDWRFTPQNRPAFDIDAFGVRHVATPGGYDARRCQNPVCGLYHTSSADGLDWSTAEFIPGSDNLQGWQCPEVACFGGRTYIAWLVDGLYLTWTDDGESFVPPLFVPGPAADRLAMDVDRSGALHIAWADYLGDIHYLRSTPGLQPRFYPPMKIWEAVDEGADSWNLCLGVDSDEFVSIAWIGTVKDSYPLVTRLRFAHLHDGIRLLPPLLLESDRPRQVQLAVSPEGPVTIVYVKYCERSEPRIFTYVAMDGRSFEGPFPQTEPPHGFASLSQRRCVRAEAGGKVHALWGQKWKWGRAFPLYVESWDYGRTFPRREITDPEPWNPPTMSDPMLALMPDGTRCLVDAVFYYSECGG
ncbi:MAG: hypothetical protein AB1486_07665 [Planctomycetota bacterium]